MRIITKLKPNISEAKKRLEAWWQGEIIDRPPLMVRAPRRKKNGNKIIQTAKGEEEVEVKDSFFNPEMVIPRLEKQIENVYWGGEAIPVIFPVAINMAAILAAYLGSPLKFINKFTVWCEPAFDSWEKRKSFCFDHENIWWKKSARLLHEGAKRAPGRYYVGVPDLNGPTEILSRLRSSEALALDIILNRDEINKAVDELTCTWYRYWQASHGIIHQFVGGYFSWLRIWSKIPSTDLQCDFSCMISEKDFDELILPSLEKQTEWIPRTIYHLDGPDALRHLDSLLNLKKLSGIQWVPGAGAPPVSKWLPILKKIQEAGKLIYASVNKEEVIPLFKELHPEGVLFTTKCSSRGEAENLLEKISRLY